MNSSPTPALLTLCLMLAGAGCTSIRQYDGAARPSGEVAVLIRQDDGWIHTIDGKWRGLGNLKRYEFLPGTHTLKVYYGPVGSFYHAADYLPLSVDLKPGHIYDLKCTVDLPIKQWSAVVKDEASGEIVSQMLPSGH